MKVAAIIQARMGSSRLPGKVLKEVLGKPLLGYQLERVMRAAYIDNILVATTDQYQDNSIVSLCQTMQVPYYRGSETDVLERYYFAARHIHADVIVRLTSDCPLIDPTQIDRIIQRYHQMDHPLCFVSNTLKRTFPRGMDTEVFDVNVLQKAYDNAATLSEREHVTKFITNNPHMFTLSNVTYSNNYSHYRWTVDHIEDFILVKKIIETLYPRNTYFTLEDILQLFKAHPEWQRINTAISQKED